MANFMVSAPGFKLHNYRFFCRLFIVCLLIFSNSVLKAQNNEKFFKATKALFLEVGGNGIVSSLNFDKIFVQRKNYILSYRLGIASVSLISFRPGIIGEVNFLTNNSNHHAEFGVSTLLYAYSSRTPESPYSQINPVLIGRIGYRYQKPNGGLFFRIGFTPGISLNKVQYINYWSKEAVSNSPIIWGGVSVGKSF